MCTFFSEKWKFSIVNPQNCLKFFLEQAQEFNCPAKNKPEISDRPCMVDQAVRG